MFVMRRHPPRSTRPDTLCPYPPLFRSRRPVIVGHLLEVVPDLYHYRDHLAGGGLAFEPWAGQAPARVAGYRHVRENRTPRFPEEVRSEEHTSELQSLMRISYAVFCLKKKKNHKQ